MRLVTSSPTNQLPVNCNCYTSFFAMCSSRISCTVRATMTLWLLAELGMQSPELSLVMQLI